MNTDGQLVPASVSAFRWVDQYDYAAAIDSLVGEALDALGLPDDYVRPHDRVVLKPNWVKEHDERHPGPGQWEHVVTHPAVIAAVIRSAGTQLAGRGSRPQECHPEYGVTLSKTRLPGDPAGETFVGLNDASEFVGFHGDGRLFGASFNMAETNERHSGGRHEYMLCRTPMDADVLINLPKLKSHKKVGVTCALKNLVGINANKNWLPHHTEGTPDQGGDQFPASTAKAKLEHSWMGRAKRIVNGRPLLSRLFVPVKKLGRLFFGDTQKVVRSGNWHGNDTCWRMVLDLNKCLYDFDGAGQPRQKPLRYLAVVDGIIGGEGNGPMSPDAKPCGVILAGIHPAAVDMAAATLMGFDWQKLRLLKNSFEIQKRNFIPFRSSDISLASNKSEWDGPLGPAGARFSFKPHFGLSLIHN